MRSQLSLPSSQYTQNVKIGEITLEFRQLSSHEEMKNCNQ
ncbi:hypothetical protein AM1_1541 [Acaryochloris marina MBIC11017]|uniref:Uncharacterized protein n=1 Tax=Acaryochloris marina (strain MBIC 11017) TaxID=329726 RepID=B0C931_ACAM1|nr:hypothetical protein AM1_1541 [Acaryochloris marina MBIC11017]